MSRSTDALSTLDPFTPVEVARLMFFRRMLNLVREVPGDIVECGVGVGRSLLYLTLLSQEEGPPRDVWGFDSFEGFPDPSPEDRSPRRARKGQLSGQQKQVRLLFETAGLAEEMAAGRVKLVKGFFEDSLSRYAGPGIALLHADVDLYQSYLDVLAGLYDRVNPGGVIVFDEYMDGLTNVNYPGARRAIDAFFADKAARIQRDRQYGKYYLVKPPS